MIQRIDKCTRAYNSRWSISRAVSVDKTLPNTAGLNGLPLFTGRLAIDASIADHTGFVRLGDVNSRSASRPDR
jgi:hypothetical protein